MQPPELKNKRLSYLKKLSIKFTIVAAAFISVFYATYFLSLNSDAHDAGILFIKNNDKIKSEIGAIEKVRLQFWGHSFRSGNMSGDANFSYNVSGSLDAGVAHLHLEKKLGVWSFSEGNFILSNKQVVPLLLQQDESIE